jgi:hypothetical protein
LAFDSLITIELGLLRALSGSPERSLKENILKIEDLPGQSLPKIASSTLTSVLLGTKST